MAKRKRRNDDDRRSGETRIPLGAFPTDIDIGEVVGLLGKAGVLPRSIDVASVVKGMRPGTWWRVARGVGQCADGHRDGIVAGLLTPTATARHPESTGWIVLTCVDECEGRSVNLFFDREGVRDLVNGLADVVSESERRESEAAETAVS